MEQFKDFIHVCYFISFLVFKSTKAAEPVAITAWKSSLYSPNYPSTYPANSNFTWIKSVSIGNKIKIIICLLQTQCDGDYLEIRDGDSLTSPLIARYCGSSGSAQVASSSGTRILLHFVSDNVTNEKHRGFILRHTGECKVHTNATSGVITTPNYPNNYQNYMDCLWTIQLHPSVLITLECYELALEYKEGCTLDYMEILAGVSVASPVLGRYCGVYNNSLTFERDGNISIRCVSDGDKEFSGFRCAYDSHKVRGDWTEWTIWTECSQTCHQGNQTRYRTCVNPLPESGLELVCGDVEDVEMRSCLVSNCSVTNEVSISIYSSASHVSTYSRSTPLSISVTAISSRATAVPSSSQFRVTSSSSYSGATLSSHSSLVTSTYYLHSVSLISLTIFESHNSQTADATKSSSFSVAGNLLFQKKLSFMDISEISPNKTLNLTNQPIAVSLGMSQGKNIVTMTSIEDHNTRNTLHEERTINSPTNYDVNATSVRDSMTNTINDTLALISAVSDGWTAPVGISKSYSSALLIATAQNSDTLTTDIFSSAKEDSQVASTSLQDSTRSSSYATFSLATGIAISHSNVVTDGQNTQIRTQTIADGLNEVSVQTMASLGSTSTVFVFSTRDRTFSSSEGTENSPRNYQSNEVYSSPTPYTIFGTRMAARGSQELHQKQLGFVSTVDTSVTQTWCCKSSSAFWQSVPESGIHLVAHGESTRASFNALQTEFPRTVQETSGLGTSVDDISGSEADGSKTASNFHEQSAVSTSKVRTTSSRLSSTIFPPNAAPSHPPGDSVTPTASNFPWHLIPFLVIIFIIIVVLSTYYLRIPDIIDTIILAIKERRKKMKAAKPDKSLNLPKGNFSTAGFDASTFHSYQRELFYDAALNYAMFEQGTTKPIEFSSHFDEEESSVSEESIEIYCVMEDEHADRKQGHDSLSEMFDTSVSDVVRSLQSGRRGFESWPDH